MNNTLVVQSHAQPAPYPWIEQCLQTVQHWAAAQGYGYRFIGDELFDLLPADIHARADVHTVVKADLARLLALKAALSDGYGAAIWCDADVVCFAPASVTVPEADFALGREVWIQRSTQRSGAPRAYIKVHNAFLLFRRDNSFLDFYIGAATRLLRALDGACVPQFIGPKFLTAIHNIARCPVAETCGMLSPPVIADLLKGGGSALDMFRAHSPQPVAMANVCASLAGSADMAQQDMGELVTLLLRGGTAI